ncbi:MAG: T9SS type A sorting domain-containing protein [Candidatus Hatepunaea meridiana]|nr:T9SS type A sorting domain-containing protein [Candidatus Hatepunaea meridiana]
MVGQSYRDRAHFGMIVRADSEGEEIWRRIFTNNEDIRLAIFGVVVETPDGGFAMGQSTGAENVRLSRVNSEGEFIWSALYPVGGGQYDFYSLILMEDFGYVLGGFSGVGDWLVCTEPDELSENAWNLQASDDDHDFGDVHLDSVQIWELTLTNEGQQPVEVLDITTDSVAFSVDFDDILTLEPDEEASIPVTFTPIDSIAYTGVLTIHTYWRDLVVELSGTGVALSAPEEPNSLRKFALHEVYPNPFNSVTTLQYDVSQNTNLQLSVYNLNGRLVEILYNDNIKPGSYSLTWNAGHLPSGLYLVRMKTPEGVWMTKTALVK